LPVVPASSVQIEALRRLCRPALSVSHPSPTQNLQIDNVLCLRQERLSVQWEVVEEALERRDEVAEAIVELHSAKQLSALIGQNADACTQDAKAASLAETRRALFMTLGAGAKGTSIGAKETSPPPVFPRSCPSPLASFEAKETSVEYADAASHGRDQLELFGECGYVHMEVSPRCTPYNDVKPPAPVLNWEASKELKAVSHVRGGVSLSHVGGAPVGGVPVFGRLCRPLPEPDSPITPLTPVTPMARRTSGFLDAVGEKVFC
jgi:hypothetical protein